MAAAQAPLQCDCLGTTHIAVVIEGHRMLRCKRCGRAIPWPQQPEPEAARHPAYAWLGVASIILSGIVVLGIASCVVAQIAMARQRAEAP